MKNNNDGFCTNKQINPEENPARRISSISRSQAHYSKRNSNVIDFQSYSRPDLSCNSLKGKQTLRAGKTEKVLKTIMFTDIVKSTQLAYESGDSKWIKILQSHNHLVRASLRKYAGMELQIIGDCVLMCFNSAQQAIDCARNIQKDIKKLDFRVRIGIHTGEVLLVNESRLCGLAVHIASRVTDIACENQIVVSQTVKDIVIGSDNMFEHLGSHTLKGLPDKWDLYCTK